MLMEGSNVFNVGLKCNEWIPYPSWVPRAEDPHFLPNITSGQLSLPQTQTGGDRYSYNRNYIGGTLDGSAAVYLATRGVSPPKTIFNWDILYCSLYNASYDVNVTSDSNRRGFVSKPTLRALNDLTWNTNASMPAPETPSPENQPTSMSYLALMESIDRLLVGNIYGSKWSRVGGTSYFNWRKLTVQNSGLSQTLLPFTKELLPYWSDPRFNVGSFQSDPKQWTIFKTVDDPVSGLREIWLPNEAFASPNLDKPLGTAVEQLFQNITLSLFSDPTFLEDSTETVEITYSVSENIYAYNSKNLLISYGLAIGFALVAKVAGCVSIYCNGASYSNKFSTVLRTTSGQELEELVASKDRSGVDPLPKSLAERRIDLRNGQLSSEHDVDAGKVELIGEQTAMMRVLPGEPHSAASLWEGDGSSSFRSGSANAGMDQSSSLQTIQQGKTGITEQGRGVYGER